MSLSVYQGILIPFSDYDVVDSKGDWTSADPFTMTGIGAHLYGRGVIDNKGMTDTFIHRLRARSNRFFLQDL